MYTRSIKLFFGIALTMLMVSCSGPEKLAYLQTLKGGDVIIARPDGIQKNHEARIKTKDLLSISVVTTDPNASKSYNLLVPQISDAASSLLYSTPLMQPYLVDDEGEINFPLLGKFKVSGLTRKELESLIQKKMELSFSQERPIITIRIINYSVNVLGEVLRPGKYSTNNDRLTIFEGLAMSGDLTISGRRDNVKVLREHSDGTKSIFTLNLNDKNIIDSPAYYLEQNDVVYVEPNKSRARASNINAGETLAVSAFTILISLTSLMVTILR